MSRITTAKVSGLVFYPDAQYFAIVRATTNGEEYIPIGPDCGLHIYGTTVNKIDLLRWVLMTPNIVVDFGYADNRTSVIGQAVFRTDR